MVGAILYGMGCYRAGQDLQTSTVDDGYTFIVLGLLFQGLWAGSQTFILDNSVRETTPKHEISLMQSYI